MCYNGGSMGKRLAGALLISILSLPLHALEVPVDGPEGDLRFSVPVGNPRKWTAETPYLYKLLLTLNDAAGAPIEVIPSTVGFRKVEIRDSRLWVNGQVILLKGVNRHEHSPDTGHYVSRELMIRDIEIMKQ